MTRRMNRVEDVTPEGRPGCLCRWIPLVVSFCKFKRVSTPSWGGREERKCDLLFMLRSGKARFSSRQLPRPGYDKLALGRLIDYGLLAPMQWAMDFPSPLSRHKSLQRPPGASAGPPKTTTAAM